MEFPGDCQSSVECEVYFNSPPAIVDASPRALVALDPTVTPVVFLSV